MTIFQLNVNGEPVSADTEPRTSLLTVLRNHLGLKAAKFGCGQTLSTILPIAWTDLVAPVPVPFLAALVAAVTARLTAQAVLRRTP